jgi:MtN3 and saliva related transmembrane protein
MPPHEWIGGFAATLTTCSFVPQVWRVWQTKHTKDISLLMYSLFSSGVAFWLVYGILLGAWPIIIANGITLILAGTVLFLKLRFG